MKPSIVLTEGSSTIEMTAIDLQPGEDKMIADALASALMAHSVKG
jgi:L-seryl-tRNA(Ser) seleniumtransferase